MKKTSESRLRANAKYAKKNTFCKTIQFNKKTDQFVVEYLQTVPNFQNYIKKLIRKDMEDNRMKQFNLDDLNSWNDEQDRDDTLYQVECRTYRAGQSGYIEDTGDYFFAGSNDYDEAMEHYEYCKRMHANDNAIVKLTRAVQVYAGVLEYEDIEKHSTFDESKINNEI